jgi:Fe-S-cluster containining protein
MGRRQGLGLTASVADLKMRRMETGIEESERRPLNARWAEELLGRPPPEEPESSCDDCVMCDATRTADESFNPQTKCCTYYPDLPNYLVGRILLSGEGAAVADQIEKGINVTPLKIASPARYDLLFRHATQAFGKSLSLRCPYYREAEGRCGIWANRNAVCSTWFCKHTRGETGRQFWEALKHCLGAVESNLALWCALQLDLDASALDSLLARAALKSGQHLGAAELDGFVDEAKRNRHWGRWRGREVAYYERCARLVEGLSWSEVLANCGPVTTAWAKVVLEAHRKLLDRQIPSKLRVGEFLLRSVDEQTVQVGTYSATDSLELPRELINALSYFDGLRTTDAALQQVSTEQSLELSEDLVRLMVDFQVLVGD